MANARSRKDLATEFLTLAAAGAVDEAFRRFVAPDFIHHNQYFKGDRATLMAAMKHNAATMANKSFTIQKLLEEDHQVVAYSRIATDTMEIAVVHILRFEGDLIVELWDIGQLIASNSPNENGLF